MRPPGPRRAASREQPGAQGPPVESASVAVTLAEPGALGAVAPARLPAGPAARRSRLGRARCGCSGRRLAASPPKTATAIPPPLMRTLITPGAGTTKQDPARLGEQTADRAADAAVTDRPEQKTRPTPPAAFKRRGRDQARVLRARPVSPPEVRWGKEMRSPLWDRMDSLWTGQ